MGKKRHSDHQIVDNNLPHQNSDQNENRGGGIKKRLSSAAAASASEESQLLHKLNTHFKKLSKTRSKLSPAAGKDAIAIATDTAGAMHASNGGSPCNSSSTTRVLDINDDHHNNFDHIVAFKFKNGKLLDYTTSNCCSGESTESETSRTTTVTTSFVVATEIQELFGGDFTFAPDFNAAHSLVHLEFVAECDDGSGFRLGFGYGFGSSYLTDPIAFIDVGFAKYSSDMLKLSSQEEMIQEFNKNNLFD